VGDAGEAAFACAAFQFGTEADIEAFGVEAATTDEVVEVIVGGGELKEMGPTFKGNPLKNAKGGKGLEGAIDGHKVGVGKAGPGANFNGAGGAFHGQEGTEDALALFRQAHGTGAHTLDQGSQ